jgi:hypothetical protein
MHHTCCHLPPHETFANTVYFSSHDAGRDPRVRDVLSHDVVGYCRVVVERRGGGDAALPSAMSARRQASTTSLSKYARDGSPDPSARYLDFCNAFWGPNDAGVDVLFARMRGASRTMEELRSFWKDRYPAFAFLVILLFLFSVGPPSRRTTRNGSLNSPK